MGNIDWQLIGAMLFCLVVAAIFVSPLFWERNQDDDLTGRLDRLNKSMKKNIATLQEIEVGMQSTYVAVAQILIDQACRRNTYEYMVIQYIDSHQDCPLYGLAWPGEMYEKVFDAWGKVTGIEADPMMMHDDYFRQTLEWLGSRERNNQLSGAQ